MNIIENGDRNGFDIAAITSPADIRGLSLDGLYTLAAQLRAPLIDKLAAHGGHVGPNLGFLEATVALHYVFDTPHDKLVFDVSHQSYVHKMLTGRIKAFLDPEDYNAVTGYTQPTESPYDLFAVGHTSTSVALAAGLAKARDLKGGHEHVVAVIGDGSLSGGEAFEGLDYGATLGSNFIVVVNDNQMSIAPNHGGIYANLKLLRDTNGTAECNMFRAMGYDYMYVEYGNDLRALVKAFRKVRACERPTVVHINTMKGEGLPVAEQNKEKFHFSAPFDPKTGVPLHPDNEESYIDIFGRVRDILRRRMGHERRDSSRDLRRTHDHRHTRNQVPRSDERRGVSVDARLGHRPARKAGRGPHALRSCTPCGGTGPDRLERHPL